MSAPQLETDQIYAPTAGSRFNPADSQSRGFQDWWPRTRATIVTAVNVALAGVWQRISDVVTAQDERDDGQDQQMQGHEVKLGNHEAWLFDHEVLLEEHTEDLAEAADDIDHLQDLTSPLRPGKKAEFRLLDRLGSVALRVSGSGRTTLGDLERTSTSDDEMVWRDRTGAVAMRINRDGSLHLGDVARQATSDDTIIWRDRTGAVAMRINPDGSVYIGDLDAQATRTKLREIHVLPLSGQSNQVGTGYPPAVELCPPHPRILQYGATRRRIEVAPTVLDHHSLSRGIGPGSVLAREYLRTVGDDVAVLLVPCAHSGTVLGPPPADSDGYTWDPTHAADAAHDLYNLSVAQIREAVTAAAGLAPVVKVVAVAWNQGEGNSGVDTTPAQHAARLDRLIAAYRTDLEDPDMPFLVGQMSQSNVMFGRVPIDQAHAETPARMLRTGFAPSCVDGNNHSDITHLSRIGVEHLGRSYLAAYRQALVNTAEVAALPPQHVTAALQPDGSHRIGWTAPACRVTGYQVETSLDGQTWTVQTRTWPMYLHHTLPPPAGRAQVRVTSLNDQNPSAPSTPLTIGA